MRGRIGMGLVGPGFVGVHHIDAVRRLGFVDVVAVAGSLWSVRQIVRLSPLDAIRNE